MLVLSRRESESILVGDGPDAIKVVVIGFRGNRVRIGVDAPASVRVDRSEVREKIDAATEQ